MVIRYFVYGIIVLLLLSGCVEPQKFAALENRVAAMEMENNRQLLYRKKQLEIEQSLGIIEKRLNDTVTQEEYAELKYSIQTIREEFQRLQGLMEEINHRFEEYNQKGMENLEKKFEQLDHAISKNYERLIRLEKYMGFEPSIRDGVDDAGKPGVSAKETGKDSEQELYAFAKKLFDDGEMEDARIQFENFINKYPDSDNADNARFWIADSYYAEKWFEKAILEYQKVIEDYPDSNKLAAARLKQGYAFAELGEKANARLILLELLKKHPDTNEARYAQKKLESLK